MKFRSPEQATAPRTKPGWKTTEHWMTWALHALTALVASGVFQPGNRWAAVAGLLTSGLAQWKYTQERSVAKSAANADRRRPAPPSPSPLVPYRAGTRRSRSTGQTVYVFEFKAARANAGPREELPMFDAIAQFITPIVLRVAHDHDKARKLGPDFDAKVSKGVADALNVAGDALAILAEVHAATKR